MSNNQSGDYQQLTRRSVLRMLSGITTLSVGSTVATSTVAAAPGDIQWEFEPGRRSRSAPTVSDGTVFIGSVDDNLYAVDIEKGEKSGRMT
jgi:outer membrane protein assembly factor BamB